MGDGGHRGEQQGSGERSSCAQYTWEEVQEHNLTGDQWLVIERKVYNVSEWTKRHPGGSRVLEHYIGEDATVTRFLSDIFHIFIFTYVGITRCSPGLAGSR